MKVLIIGGTDHKDNDRKVVRILGPLHYKQGIDAVIYTGSVGASKHAAEWVAVQGLKHIERRPRGIRVDPSMFEGAITLNKDKSVHVNHDEVRKACRKVHKSMIEDHNPDLVIAYPGINTQSIITYATAANIQIMELT